MFRPFRGNYLRVAFFVDARRKIGLPSKAFLEGYSMINEQYKTNFARSIVTKIHDALDLGSLDSISNV